MTDAQSSQKLGGVCLGFGEQSQIRPASKIRARTAWWVVTQMTTRRGASGQSWLTGEKVCVGDGGENLAFKKHLSEGEIKEKPLKKKVQKF